MDLPLALIALGCALLGVAAWLFMLIGGDDG